MFHAVKNLLKESLLVQRTYRRYVQPHLPQYEPETFILRGIKFDQCVDVGAHAGTFSILLSHNADRIYAFEPSSHSFAILENLNLPNVTTYNLALGDQSGEMEISFPTVAGEIDYALATLRTIDATEYGKCETQRVRVARFDDFEKEIDFARIEFVKIDVEGFEMHVLRGMDRLLARKKPAFLIEIEQRHNSDYLKIFDHLGALGYEAYVTMDGVFLQALDLSDLPRLQSAERLFADEARKFRVGERKNYINNIFFLQPDHKSKYPIVSR
jgi:FkbM family methyltransferase